MALRVGMPLHWLLGRIDKLGVRIFLLVGAMFAGAFPVLVSREIDVLAIAFMAVSGSVCLGFFWYIAVYLPSRLRS